jgi:hypothetical protein
VAFDGNGTFLRLYSWLADATAGTKIRADRHDDEDNGFADGLSHCITKDGQTAITQNIPFNSRRIVSLADPIDPQDAATKDYADTKMPLDGSAPMTGDMIIDNDDPTITLDGKDGFNNTIYGDKDSKHRWAVILGNSVPETGSDAGSNFNLLHYADAGTELGSALDGVRATGLLTVKADPTAALGIATKQYADATAVDAASSKLPLAGGTITGSLRVNGELIAGLNYLRFGTSGGPGYILWSGGGSYTLGGGGTIWHSGNFNPNTPPVGITSDVRLAIAGDHGTQEWGNLQVVEPYSGAVITGQGSNWAAGYPIPAIFRWRYLQTLKGGTWFTVGYA